MRPGDALAAEEHKVERTKSRDAGVSYPFRAEEKWDVHTHTTPSPEASKHLARFDRHADFVRVRAHATRPHCAEIVNNRGEVQRVVERNAFDGAARLKDCAAHGVTMQVLSPTPMMIPDYVDHPADAAEICKILNDDNADMVSRFPGRFLALGALPMAAPDLAVKELQRIRGTLGMRGVEINSNINGLDLDDPRFYPIFEAAAELGMAVFIHPWGGFMAPAEERLKQRMNAAHRWRPWLLALGMETALAFDALRGGGIHERLPGLRVLYAHGGGMFPALLGRLEHGAYCRPDLFRDASRQNPYQAVRESGVFTDSLTHNPWVLELLIQTLGVNRIAMGSDYPYPLGEIDPFDAKSGKDSQGNARPYDAGKGIYPGHMIEHLPTSAADRASAWEHFNWLPRDNSDGPRQLPSLTETQKRRILSGTAKEWLGYTP
jgi:aminocarboxymuconate-semialdehyde decarboxylase